ncbi:CgeB family protein [Bordetella petrii]|uniref:CgeB family protein n=1 Tax=Bordetella petrii TaxID=94624 RepID=UPI0006846CCC|nr:glycosyltransferase [Bordetella petrii]
MLFIRNLFKPKHGNLAGEYSALKVAIIADELTRSSLAAECQTFNLTPSNYRRVFQSWKPDLLFVESAWHGYKDAWKYKIASYPLYPERNNESLRTLVLEAKQLGIPAVFWNKEDGVHYDRFIATARLFENIFTVDINCVDKYKAAVADYKNIAPLMFPVQSRFHYFSGRNEKEGEQGFSSFVGSYSKHIHLRRRRWQDMLFETIAPFGLNIYDRNFRRKAAHYRYPSIPGLNVYNGVPYRETADIYRGHRINLNVNTIEDSPTMYSRRLIEIIAVGGVAISTPSAAVERLFSEFCYIVHSKEELLSSIDDVLGCGYRQVKEKAEHGAQVIAQQHTWEKRLKSLEALSIF